MLLLICVCFIASCRRSGSEKRYDLKGKVLVAEPEKHLVTVSHEDIKGYMPAMTMAFPVAPGASGAVNAGDRVRFRLSVTAEQSQADRFEVTAHGAALTRAVD